MVAKIKSGKSLIGALNYNENKVKLNKAELIEAGGYHKDAADLNFHDKLLRLTDLASRNERTKTNTLHLSLNFANSENLPVEVLQNISRDYLGGIGFGDQPYLVYRHFDAGHPHIHIVTTNIKKDGNRISLHYLGQNQSEKTRKAIELKYQLIRAEEQTTPKPAMKTEPAIAEYGRVETKRAITNVLGFVVRAYKYTSIGELNAVLAQYKIAADVGSKESRMHAKGGLVYWMLDRRGEKIGVPVKASTIYGRPTLKTLEESFKLNVTLRKPYKDSLIAAIDDVMGTPQSKRTFKQLLGSRDIRVVFRENTDGRVYGVTFIDMKNKAVFNGSDLGKEYSANLLAARLIPDAKQDRKHQPRQREFEARYEQHGNDLAIVDALFQPERNDPSVSNKFKKRKRRKGLNL